MRLRSVSVVIAAAVVALSVAGCAPEPEPTPTPTAVTDPTPSATPTADPAGAPEAAFDVTCADVAAVMSALVGETDGPVEERLSLVSSPSWYPGPAQYMMQRANGIACSSGGQDRNWTVTIVPGAQVLLDGAIAQGADATVGARCTDYGCFADLQFGDVLLSASIAASGFTEADGPRVETELTSLASSAADSLHDVTDVPSAITGIDCATLLSPEALGEQLATNIELVELSVLGGWSIPAEVYFVANGSPYCLYAAGQDIYRDQNYLTVTALPAGAWAFDRIDEATPIEVDGAAAARTSVDSYDRPVLDLKVGADWIRLTTFDGEGAPDLGPLAAQIVESLTAG
ncbi:hypothetical protein [Microbacterium sp. NPDC087665]|uniref:hypothetical protein n=1 Tax=Microbacterium sp. NPDC087665 TaxID=3364194 RepID=UPI0038124A05